MIVFTLFNYVFLDSSHIFYYNWTVRLTAHNCHDIVYNLQRGATPWWRCTCIYKRFCVLKSVVKRFQITFSWTKVYCCFATVMQTCSCRRCPRVKYLSRTIRVPITFCMASQCLVLKVEFRKLVMTGMPCLKLVTFCLSRGMTLLGGKPEIGNIICRFHCKQENHEQCFKSFQAKVHVMVQLN